MTPIFTSERIDFVPVSEDLVPDYLAMINDRERVGRFIGRTEPITAEQDRRWVQKKLAEKAPVFSMVDRATGAFIGNIELMDVADGAGELGVAITAARQEQGYGSEAIPAFVRYAMDELGLSRVYLKAFPFNARAIHVYEKCGFREYDRTEDDVFMEILRPVPREESLSILPYTGDRLEDVLAFERRLREEEDVWGWAIDDAYIAQVKASFEGDTFRDSLSFLAYEAGQVVGRIDAALIRSRFDGSTKAYLDWICVLKSCRHRGVGQALLETLRRALKQRGIDTLIALTAANEEAQRFYKSVPNSLMRDVGIWIDI